jgi:sister-chromatid-cohesion protein PDS5
MSVADVDERIDRLEMPLARLIVVLANHPDMLWEASGLKDLARLVLSCVGLA